MMQRDLRQSFEALHAEDKENSEPKLCDCHECQTVVDIDSDECPNCHHKICERCLKEGQFTVSGDESVQSVRVDSTMTSAQAQAPIEAHPFYSTTAS